MIRFIQNIGDYFSSNYFDEDFVKKVLEKTSYAAEDVKLFQKKISALKDKYFRYKQNILEGRLRIKDKVTETHGFHTIVLTALGYDAKRTEYHELFHVDEKTVLPVRHTLFRGDQPHLMIMEMQPLIKEGDEEPDGLFEQQYNVEEDDTQTPPQKYHRSQWENVFKVPDGLKISPMVINKAVSQLFLLDAHRRPKYILLCAGNVYYLLEQEKWFRGSYLEFDLESLFDEASINRNYYSLFYFLLAKETLAPQSEIVLMEQLDEDSHKSAYEVTQDLKEGVIHAVETIANEAVYFLKIKNGGLEKVDAEQLKNECLTYVYRLLFLFYAESREDLDILPAKDEVYLHGYSLEMLRDLEQVPLNTASSQNGYFFHESLSRLFSLLSNGYREKDQLNRSFRVRHLDSPLFNDDTLTILPQVKIRNVIWQDIICQLSLSKKKRGKTRGRISYANLGINQLGSVYESLLAFRGFFAESDYIEVHRKPKKKNETSSSIAAKDGSYLVPRHRLDDFDIREVYHEANGDMRIIPQGTFIYRLSGRDRQKSASYYTPEVLTQCTVKYTLKPILERLDQGEMEARDLLDLKILEPAMGAAAFHNEVINQLAEAYLQYRQLELNEKVAPDKYREETQKVKAYIALNNVYGVDINPTAVELGKLSLWLNVIHKDMQTPFFGYRLGTGNAVVGAWLKVYPTADLLLDPKDKRAKKEWWTKAPKHLRFHKTNRQLLRNDKQIYHFLLPDKGMVPSANIKLLKADYPEEAKKVSDWKKSFCAPISANELPILQKLCKQIDTLLEDHYRHQQRINRLTAGKVALFGEKAPELGLDSYAEKERLAAERLSHNAPYFKLRMIMDYWCSLWFWDMREAAELPTRMEWYQDIANILDVDLSATPSAESDTGSSFDSPTPKQAELFRRSEQLVLGTDGIARTAQEAIVSYTQQNRPGLFENRRLQLVRQYAQNYRFFHYQLEFIEVFKERGGFDVIVGNPPWVKLTFSEIQVLQDFDPIISLRNVSSAIFSKTKESLLFSNREAKISYINEQVEMESITSFVRSISNNYELQGQQPDLYKYVILNSLKSINDFGKCGIIHPSTVLEDSKGGLMRQFILKKLDFLFQFRNHLKLFPIGHSRQYLVAIYSGKPSIEVDIKSINNLLHPRTIDKCFLPPIGAIKNGVPGIKRNTKDGGFQWDLRGDDRRIIKVDNKLLELLSEIDGSENPKLLSFHSKNDIKVLESLFKKSQKRVADLAPYITEGLHETNQVKKGNLTNLSKETTSVDNIKGHVFIGSEIHICTPYYRSANVQVTNRHDFSNYWYCKDLPFKYPNMVFSLTDKGKEIINTEWYLNKKLGFNKMLDPGIERTLQPCILPENTLHTGGIISVSEISDYYLNLLCGITSTILFDFFIKITKKANVSSGLIKSFPIHENNPLIISAIIDRVLDMHNDSNRNAIRYSKQIVNDLIQQGYDASNCFLIRRQNLLELDVLVAKLTGLNIEDIIDIYNIYFPVSQQYEEDTWFDRMGNIVFTCNSQGLKGIGVNRSVWNEIKDFSTGETYEHTIEKSELYFGKKVIYHAPFDKCDRVEDYKVAWAHFAEVFRDK